jgi:hypothetical protein
MTILVFANGSEGDLERRAVAVLRDAEAISAPYISNALARAKATAGFVETSPNDCANWMGTAAMYGSHAAISEVIGLADGASVQAALAKMLPESAAVCVWSEK